MSYVVFVLGILLTAAGGLSIYDGFDIIQLERGWTEVIAGTTAIAGGIMTMALGLILRRLEFCAIFTQPQANRCKCQAASRSSRTWPPLLLLPPLLASRLRRRHPFLHPPLFLHRRPFLHLHLRTREAFSIFPASCAPRRRAQWRRLLSPSADRPSRFIPNLSPLRSWLLHPRTLR